MNGISISYKKLWKLLIDRAVNKSTLREVSGLSAASIAKLSNGKNINTDVFVKICETLHYDLSYIAEIIHDDAREFMNAADNTYRITVCTIPYHKAGDVL